MAAALTGDRALLEFLSASDSAADLSTRNSDGRTAAFFAAMNGHVDCLAFVLGDADYAAGGGGSDNNNSKRGKKSDRRSRRTAAVSTAAETADADQVPRRQARRVPGRPRRDGDFGLVDDGEKREEREEESRRMWCFAARQSALFCFLAHHPGFIRLPCDDLHQA